MQIFMSKDYAYQFIDNDIERIFYDPTLVDDVEQGLRLINGTINKYTIGAAWHTAGFTIDDINWPWYWSESYQFNMDHGFYPGDDLLLTSRIPSSMFLAGSVIIVFLIGLFGISRPAAYIATLYYALNPAVLVNGRRAMMEGSMLFGGLLTVLAGILLVRQRGWRAWSAALLLGFATGIAVASKHTNVIVVFSVFLGCGIAAIVEVRQNVVGQLVNRIAQLAFAGILSMSLFLALNPAWWNSPLLQVRNILNDRVDLLEGQIDVFGGYAGFGGQYGGFFRQVFVGHPMYFEANSFRDAMVPQIATYEATPYAGVVLPGVSVTLFALFVIGLLCLVGVLRLVEIQNPARWVVGSWAIITTGVILFATPLEWQRYYLPVFPVVGILAAMGLIRVLRLFLNDARHHSNVYRKGSVKVRQSTQTE